MKNEIHLLDVVALTTDIPKHNLFRGEIGAVVECYPNDGYEVEFVSLDGYTYALIPLGGNQLLSLRQKPQRLAKTTMPATLFADQPAVEVMAVSEQ